MQEALWAPVGLKRHPHLGSNYKTIENRGNNVQEMLTGKREYFIFIQETKKCWLFNIINKGKKCENNVI